MNTHQAYGKTNAVSPHIRFVEGMTSLKTTESRSLFKGMVLGLLIVSGWVTFAATWNNKSGGVLTDGANYAEGVAPGPSDGFFAWDTVNNPITMTDAQPSQTNTVITFQSPIPIVFDLGVGHSFLASARISFTYGREVIVTSGRFGLTDDCYEAFYLANGGTSPCSLVADGADAVLDAGRNGLFSVGCKEAARNALIVRNGAVARGGLEIGTQTADAYGNIVLISGAGSRYEFPQNCNKTLNVGVQSAWNTLMVSNSAAFNAAGVPYFRIGQASTEAHDNAFVLADGATGRYDGELFIGFDAGRNDNRVSVLSESCLDLSGANVYVGNSRADGNLFEISDATVVMSNDVAATKNVAVGFVDACDNRLEVRDGGILACSYLGFTIGQTSGSTGNVIRVANGGRIEGGGTGWDWVSFAGNHSRLEIDNGVWDRPGFNLRSGPDAGATDNVFSFMNGSTVNVDQFIVGDHAARNLVVIENSEVNASAMTVAVGHTPGVDAEIRENAIRFGGTNTEVRIAGTAEFYRDLTIDFSIPEQGYASVPFESIDLVLSDQTVINVTVSDKYVKGGRIVLMRSQYNISNLDKVTFTTNVGRFDNTANEIAIKVPRRNGLCVMVR